jgi:hypothetical protein
MFPPTVAPKGSVPAQRSVSLPVTRVARAQEKPGGGSQFVTWRPPGSWMSKREITATPARGRLIAAGMQPPAENVTSPDPGAPKFASVPPLQRTFGPSGGGCPSSEGHGNDPCELRSGTSYVAVIVTEGFPFRVPCTLKLYSPACSIAETAITADWSPSSVTVPVETYPCGPSAR